MLSILLMITGDDKPGNYENTISQEKINLIICIVIILILSVSFSLILLAYLKTRKELKKPQTKIVINKNNLSTEEAKLIENYRNLTPDQKIIIDNSLQTFNQNNTRRH